MPGAVLPLNDITGDDTEPEFNGRIRQLFDRSVSNVQGYSVNVQRSFLEPAYERAGTFGEEYPVLSLYIGILTVLSVLPVAIFFSTSGFILLSSIFLALSLAIVFSACVISLFGIFLFLTMFILSTLALLLTVLALGTYVFVRLILHVREQPSLRAGIRQWVSELQDHLRARLPNNQQVNSTPGSTIQTNGMSLYEEKMAINGDGHPDGDSTVKKEAVEKELLSAAED